ncbi:PAS domain-containing protein, partial [archaeon]|nr:PAS domain-containing protein [archaeon]
MRRLRYCAGSEDAVMKIKNTNNGKDAEDALRRSEERFRDLFDNINDGIIVVDASGTITYFNKIFVEMSGYPASELQGKNMGELIHPEDLKLVTENHKK